jgi:phenylacetate-coenzyme A ligase PaaK-like adenylate-forming protein
LCGQFLVEAREKSAREGTQAADAVRAMAKSIHAGGGKVPGFGHPLHRPVDPRTERIFALAEERGVAGIHVGLARHAQAAVGEVWQKQLPMNVSMAIAAILLDLDFPAAMIKAIPILARTSGLLAHLAEWAAERGIDIRNASVRNILVAGEPGGGEPALRARLQEAWGASVTEAMGIGDISVSLWGECEARSGMHFSGGGFVHFELIDAETGAPLPIDDGAEGELV